MERPEPRRGVTPCQGFASPQNYGYRTGGLSRRSTVTPKGVAVTRTSVREYLSKQRERYQGLRRRERSRLVTEIVAVTGYHRKAVLRCLRATPRPRAGRRPVGDPGGTEAMSPGWRRCRGKPPANRRQA